MGIPGEKPNGLEIDYESLGKKYDFGEPDLFRDKNAIAVTVPIRGDADASDIRVMFYKETIEDRLELTIDKAPHMVRKNIAITERIDEERVVATYRNGILDVVLPLYNSRSI